MDHCKVVSARILDLCRDRGITVGTLCSTAGTTASTVHDIVTGETKNPRIFTLKKLCDTLGITLSEFFDTPKFNSMDIEID
ncbi:MAG: helix-turn-helix transcriptional regulator [Ruthenibacterium sp.]